MGLSLNPQDPGLHKVLLKTFNFSSKVIRCREIIQPFNIS